MYCVFGANNLIQICYFCVSGLLYSLVELVEFMTVELGCVAFCTVSLPLLLIFWYREGSC